jgi:hypothetical protein
MLHIFINVSLSLILMMMGIQDFKYRAISWYAFPVLAVFLVLSNPAVDYIEIGLNLAFILLNYALATLLISLKHRKPVNLMKSHIGLGDVLMLLCLAVYFPVLNFFLFYLASLLLIAAGTGMYLLWRNPAGYTVPLAGLQSFLLLALMLTAWRTGLSIHTATWIESQPWFQNYLL